MGYARRGRRGGGSRRRTDLRLLFFEKEFRVRFAIYVDILCSILNKIPHRTRPCYVCIGHCVKRWLLTFLARLVSSLSFTYKSQEEENCAEGENTSPSSNSHVRTLSRPHDIVLRWLDARFDVQEAVKCTMLPLQRHKELGVVARLVPQLRVLVPAPRRVDVVELKSTARPPARRGRRRGPSSPRPGGRSAAAAGARRASWAGGRRRPSGSACGTRCG